MYKRVSGDALLLHISSRANGEAQGCALVFLLAPWYKKMKEKNHTHAMSANVIYIYDNRNHGTGNIPKASAGAVSCDAKKEELHMKKNYAVSMVFKQDDPQVRRELLKESILRIIINELQEESVGPDMEVQPSDE